MEKKKFTETHDEKVNRVLPFNGPSPSDVAILVNLTNKELSAGHVSLFSKGVNFALAPHSIPKRELLVEIENKLRHIKDVTGTNLARSRITSV